MWDILKRIWETICFWRDKRKEKEPDSLPEPDTADDLPIASLSRSAYSLEQYRAMPVHHVTMALRGNKLVTTGECLKISEAFGMGCEITWWFRWDGKTHARCIEGYRASDCADGSAAKDIPDGWYPFRGCGYYHEGDEALTWWDVADSTRGENIGYSASKVISRRNNATEWRTGIVMPE